MNYTEISRWLNKSGSSISDFALYPQLVSFLETVGSQFSSYFRLAVLVGNSSQDKSNTHTTYSIAFGYFVSAISFCILFVNVWNIFVFKFSLSVSFPFIVPSISNFVFCILFGCSPFEIRQVIVLLVTIQMTTLVSLWTWVNKSKQNESMNNDNPNFASAFSDFNSLVSTPTSSLFDYTRFYVSLIGAYFNPSTYGFNLASLRYLVIGASRNKFPFHAEFSFKETDNRVYHMSMSHVKGVCHV